MFSVVIGHPLTLVDDVDLNRRPNVRDAQSHDMTGRSGVDRIVDEVVEYLIEVAGHDHCGGARRAVRFDAEVDTVLRGERCPCDLTLVDDRGYVDSLAIESASLSSGQGKQAVDEASQPRRFEQGRIAGVVANAAASSVSRFSRRRRSAVSGVRS